MMSMKKQSLIFIALSFLFIPLYTQAATSLYLDPIEGVYSEGGTFSLKIRVNPSNECINAADIYLQYPTTSIKAIDIARGESIFSLWTEEPSINREAGIVHFSGGLPGGYCGRIDGDPGFTNILAEVVFQVPGLTIGPSGPKEGKITFSNNSTILLSDGLGTPTEIISQGSDFSIVPPGQATSTQGWFETLQEDATQPEPFSIRLVRDKSVFDGRWYIVFNTLDKQSGIDHYEVYETDIDNTGYTRTRPVKQSDWVEARSPYVLTDQSLNSIVRVRAIDKAGSERISTKVPEESLRTQTTAPISKTIFYVVALLIVVVIVLIVFLIFKKRKQAISDTIKHELEEEMQHTQNEPPVEQNEGNDDWNSQH